jgi:large subunit ribosomal protein L31
MKAKIHPQYYEDLKITCACGNVIIAGSTKKELKTEICSACHPFYTGQQKLLDTAGRVDKFLAKVKKAQKMKEKKVKVVDEELDEVLHHEPATSVKEEAVQEEKVEAPVEEPAAPAKKKAAAKPKAAKAKTASKKTAAKKK